MGKFSKILGVLVLLVVIFAGSMIFVGSSKLTKTYEVQPAAVTIPNSELSRHIYTNWRQADWKSILISLKNYLRFQLLWRWLVT